MMFLHKRAGVHLYIFHRSAHLSTFTDTLAQHKTIYNSKSQVRLVPQLLRSESRFISVGKPDSVDWVRYSLVTAGWQKLCEGTKGLRRKVWTWTKILSLTYAILSRYYDLSRFAHFFEISGQKSAFFWVKNSVSWAISALLHGIYCIFH